MNNRKRNALGGLGLVALLMATTVSFAGAVVFLTSPIRVEVQEEDGLDLSLRVPAFLARAVVAFVPDRAFEEAAREVAPYADLIRTACSELNDCPDAVLVQVDSHRERVRVEKHRGSIDVWVETPSEHVRVSLPAGLVEDVLSRVLESGDRRDYAHAWDSR